MRPVITILVLSTSMFVNGQVWDSLTQRIDLPTAPPGNVEAMTTYNGKLVVIGAFTKAGGVTTTGIASWDGLTWEAFAGGITNYNGGPKDIVVIGDTMVLAGGFGEVGGQPFTERLALWTGSDWTALSSDIPSGSANALYFQVDLYVGGAFGPIAGSMSGNCIARWDGSDWYDVGSGIDGGVIWIDDMVEYKGDLYVCGRFDFAGGIPMNNIARWDGMQWYSVGNADLAVHTLYVDTVNDLLYAGGGFTVIGGVSASKIAVYDGFTWKEIGGGVDLTVNAAAVAIYHQKLYVGGFMTMAGGSVPVSYIACYDGTQWSDVGGGTDNVVTALYTWNDTLWVGGYFDTVAGGTLPAYYLAKWYDPTYGTLGLSELENERVPLKIYPNPSAGSFTVELPEPAQEDAFFQIVSMSGQLVEEIAITNGQSQTTINSNNWSNGTYQCNLVVGGRVVGSETVVVD